MRRAVRWRRYGARAVARPLVSSAQRWHRGCSRGQCRRTNDEGQKKDKARMMMRMRLARPRHSVIRIYFVIHHSDLVIWTGSFLQVFHALHPFRRAAGAEPAVDEIIQVAVHHRLHVAGLDAGPEVLDHAVRLEDITANLVAPRPAALLAGTTSSPSSSISAITSTLAKLVCRRLLESNGEMRTSRCTPRSALQKP